MDFYLCEVNTLEKDILYRLLQYSLFEESENDLNEMNDEGLFEYKYFDAYFTDKERKAYFIKEKISGKLLGFALINTYVRICNRGHSIAEYMILPKYRRNKIGKRAALEIFEKYDGDWEVEPSFGSQKAYLFWKNTIEEYCGNNYKFEKGIFIFNKKDVR